MSYKYSALMNTVCVCMMYAVVIPELLIVASLTFFLYYVCDKMLITYYYQKPPMYDDTLNKTSLELLKIAPVLMLLFGYWALGNMQIFNNKVVPLVNQNVPFSVEHTIWPSGNQALPCFIVGILILISFCLDSVFVKILKKVGLYHEEVDYDVDENLGSYFQCISTWDKKQWLAQEVHSNQALNIWTMGEWTREQLRTVKSHKNKQLKNTPSYEIIQNDLYQEGFQFTPLERCDTPQEKVVSDMIVKVLYMGYWKGDKKEFSIKQALRTKILKSAMQANLDGSGSGKGKGLGALLAKNMKTVTDEV